MFAFQFMDRKKIGLALSGGGARGFSHIGVVKVLAEHNIPIDFIAGTSAGSIVGGALASGMSADEIVEMGRRVRWGNIMRPSLSPRGILTNSPMGKFIEQNFPVNTFDKTPIPFAAVACDLLTGQEIRIRDGKLSAAIRASCAVPAVFSPIIEKNGSILVDGGVVAPMPTDAVREMGAEIVIAVDLLASGATFRSNPRTAFGMLFQSAMTLLRAASNNQEYKAEITIVPKIAHLRPDEIKKREEFVELGEEAARETIGQIKCILR